MADALHAGRSFDVDFNLAVQRQRVVDMNALRRRSPRPGAAAPGRTPPAP
jgi:hypothetical protein